MKKKKEKSIKSQIFSGYLALTLFTVFLSLIVIACLVIIALNSQVVTRHRDNQNLTQQTIIAHYGWLNAVGSTVESNQPFTLTNDPASCSLGQWLAALNEQDLADPEIRAAVNAVKEPHENIHNHAEDILEVAKGNPYVALRRFSDEIKPEFATIIASLTTITERYGVLADQASAKLGQILIISIVLIAIFIAVIVISSLVTAQKLSDKISRPISAVAGWAKKLSLGMEDLDYDWKSFGRNNSKEINTMIRSFQTMAASIQDNVRVVQRVADGDMTAFVNIRSSEDTLGKNLYRMVQSNDLLFAEILNIGRVVAEGSAQISQSSHAMADTASEQAAAVNALSTTIDTTSGLIEKNADKTKEAAQISSGIESDMKESSSKMDLLVEAVNAISASSEKISSVIKSIDDISFQTNLLALNASVEAARAGEAGKGFAVVANEVRLLAAKSSEAAKESKALIEDTIRKTHEGSHISEATSAIFAKTISDIEKIIKIVLEITEDSNEQMLRIGEIRDEVARINDAASGYAAVSEESAAASAEMNHNAELLKEAMSRFNLRKRQQGQAYIPPEKENDFGFIQAANENYRKALETGRLGEFEYIESPDI